MKRQNFIATTALLTAFAVAPMACNKDSAGGGASGASADMLSMLPKDSAGVVGISWAKARDSALFKQYESKLMENVPGEVGKIKNECGIDLFADINTVVVSGNTDSDKSIVAVKGNFDQTKVEACIVKMGGTNSGGVYTIEGEVTNAYWSGKDTVLLSEGLSPDTIKAAAANAIERFGSIDVVFNNAGYGLAGPHEAFSDEQLERQLATNLLGVMRTTREFLPHFREHGAGLFITTTSIGGLITLPFNSAYHATKWALEGWSESLWYEVAQFGIGVKTVSPGGIKTDFAGRSLELTAHPAYQASLDQALSTFMDPARADRASSAEQIAEVVFEAATDGKKTLRYVAGEDAKAMHQARLTLGDQAHMEAIREEFLGKNFS